MNHPSFGTLKEVVDQTLHHLSLLELLTLAQVFDDELERVLSIFQPTCRDDFSSRHVRLETLPASANVENLEGGNLWR